MTKVLRYLTFAPGELEARLRELAPNATPLPDASQLTGGGNGGQNGTLRKAHCCTVRYPDGRSGECRYERGGPRWHLFHFGYDGQPLPRQVWMQALGNSPAHIESKAQELAAAAYRDAIAREHQDYFRRASEPSDGSRKKNPARYRLSAGRAKEWAGKYALCQTVGETLLASGRLYDTLDEANVAWQEKHDTRLVVGCCNRLDRCWQLPRFNPLYATFDPRHRFRPAGTETSGEQAGAPFQDGSTEPAGTKAAERSGDAAEAMPSCENATFGDIRSGAEEPTALAFTRWMTEVTQDMEALYGLETDDLPDCTYADWFDSGMTPEDAAKQALALYLDA